MSGHRVRSNLIRVLIAAMIVAGPGCTSESSDGRSGAASGSTEADIPTVDTSAMERLVASAINAARDEVEQQPDQSAAWGQYAMVLDVHESFEAAQQCYERATELDPNRWEWPYRLAQIVMARDGDQVRATSLFEHAARVAPQSPTIAVNYGASLLRWGELDEAEAWLRKSIDLAADPRWMESLRAQGLRGVNPGETSARAYRHLGDAFLAGGKVDEAIKALEESDRLFPRSAAVHSSLARAFARAGRTDDARRSSEIAKQEGPDATVTDLMAGRVTAMGRSVKQLRQRITVLMDVRQFDQAEPLIRLFLEERPDAASMHGRLARCYLQLEQPNKAYAAFHRAIELDGDLVSARLGMGAFLAGTTRTDEAIEHLTHAVRLAPTEPAPHAQLGIVYGRLGELDLALDHFAKAEATGKPIGASTLANWGVTLITASRFGEAVEKLSRAVEERQQYAYAYFHLGRAHEAMGSTTDAIQAYRTVTVLESGHAAAIEALQRLGAG